MRIMRTIWGDDSEKKRESAKVAERLSSLLAADETKLAAIVHEEPPPEPVKAEETAPRPVSPPPSVPTRPVERPRDQALPASADSIARATREAVEKLRAAQEEIEASLRTRAEDQQRTLLKLASNALQRSGFQQRVIKTAADELEETVKGQLARAVRQMREQVEAARTALEAQLRAANDAFLARVREQLPGLAEEATNAVEAQKAAQSAVAAIAHATERATARLAAAQKEIEAKFDGRAAEFEKRLIEAATEELGRKGLSTKLVQQAMKELERSVKDSAEHSARKISEQADGLLGQLRGSNESLLKEAQERLATAARAALDAELRAARESFFAEVRQQVSAAPEHQANDAAIDSVRQAAEQAVARVAVSGKEIEARFQSQAEEFEKRLSETANKAAGRKELSAKFVQQTLKELESSAKESAARSLNQVVEEALRKLAATQKEMEQNFETRAKDYQKRLVEAASEELGRNGLPGHLTDQAKADIEHAAQDLLARSAEQLQQQAMTARSALDEDLRATRETFLAEARTELAQAAQPARQQAEAAAHSITEAAEQALTRLEASQREIEARFKEHSENYQKRLVDAATEELERQGVSERLIRQASEELERSAGELLARSAGELRRQAETARAALDEQLRVARESFVLEVRQRLASAAQPTIEQHVAAVQQNAQAAVESLSQAAQQAMAQLTASQRELEVSFKAEAKEHQQRLVEGAAEELKRQGISQQIIQDAIGQLEQATRDFVDRSSQELRQQAVATLGAVEQQLKARTETLLADTHEEIANLIRKPREILQQMLNDALARVVDQLRAEQVALIRKEQAPLRRQLVYLDAITQEERQRTGGQRAFLSGKELRGAGVLASVAIFAMVMVGWAAYFATRPTMQLRAEVPAAFVEQNAGWTAKRQAKEAELARAYWAAGLHDIQSNDYSFGTPLPDDPPADFIVNEKTLPDSAAARFRYWAKFRQYWADPNTWQSSSNAQAEWVQNGASWVETAIKRVPWNAAIQYHLMKLSEKFQAWWYSRGGNF